MFPMRPLLFLLTAVALAAEPAHFTSGPSRVSLVELYTSEGCSSCPPAERWLGTLREDSGLWRDFVPVAFHVDYWDRLGWLDKFSTKTFTQREYAYAAAWGDTSVYTPCIVRDGAEWQARGEKIPAPHGTPGTLAASYNGTVLRATFTPADATSPAADYEIHAAILGGGIVSKVTAGENSGETLQHEFIALALAEGAPGDAIALAVPKISGVARRALAVWVTRAGSLAPLQATGGWLAP